MLKYFARIKVVTDHTLPVDEFRMISRRKNREITNDFMI
jgi:hypothetical protein